MIEIEMSKDVKEFSPKLVGFFDARQLICIGTSSAYGIPLAYFLLQKTQMDITVALTIVVLLVAPVIACGYVKLYGMYLDVFLFQCAIPMMLSPMKRKYKAENSLAYLSPDLAKASTPIKAGAKQKKSRKEKKKRSADIAKFGGTK